MQIMNTLQNSAQAIAHLSSKDHRLARIIQQIGPIELRGNPNIFAALIDNLIAQQITKAAAHTISLRLATRLQHQLTPENILQTESSAIQQCGISQRKVGYIKAIASAVVSGKLELAKFPEMHDSAIIEQLTALPGIGPWTAEMLLIFALQRPNIISYGDLVIRRAMVHLYELKELSKAQFELYRQRYAPYASVASLYLWEYGNNLPRNCIS